MGFFRASRIAATPSVERKYVWNPTGYIDDLVQFIDSSGATDVAYFVCRHHNYNVMALLDSSGAVAERYDYDPYGQRYVLDVDYSADADGESDLANPIGHQGLMHDHETGLIYNRARMLDPVRGRFIQRDWLQYVDGMSAYAYYAGMRGGVDAEGLQTKCCEVWVPRWWLGRAGPVPKRKGNKVFFRCAFNRILQTNPTLYHQMKQGQVLQIAGLGWVQMLGYGGVAFQGAANAVNPPKGVMQSLSSKLGRFVLAAAVGNQIYVGVGNLLAITKAFNYCKQEKCTRFTHKESTVEKRSAWNPRGWTGHDRTYCEACPPKSNECQPDANGDCWR